jgi:hypothetical protein
LVEEEEAEAEEVVGLTMQHEPAEVMELVLLHLV